MKRPTMTGRRIPGARRRGAVLLEVVLALALFLTGAGVVVGSLLTSIEAARRVRDEARAADLAVTILSEVQLGLIAPEETPAPQPFTDAPEWTWQLRAQPVEDADPLAALVRVEVVVTRVDGRYASRLARLVRPAQESAELLPLARAMQGGRS